jgi:cytochrome c oxidase subunit 4
MPSVRPILVPALIILSLAKFIAVVGYFMHLKYDSKIFRYMFVAGLVLSLAVYLAMLAMFWTASSYFPFVPPLFGQ